MKKTQTKQIVRSGLLGLTAACFAASFLVTAPFAQSADLFWDEPAEGGFANDANWVDDAGNPASAPTVDDFAFIGPAPGTGGTATLDTDYGAIAGLRVGQSSAGSLLITGGGALSSNTGTFIGRDDGGVGLLSITGEGSSYTNAGGFTILGMGGGQGVEASGTITVGAGGSFTHASSDLFIVGDNFNEGGFDGTINVNSGGTVSSTGALWIGQGGGGTGTGVGTVEGTLNTQNLRVGRDGGTGELTLSSGGEINASDTFMVGELGGSAGTLNITGGTLNRTDGGITIVADLGATGTVNQSGGTFNVDAGEFWIGASGGSTGTYNLDGGEINQSSDWFIIGQFAGDGTLNMTDGTITRTGGGNFVLASQPFSTGTLNQSGGLIDLQSGNMEVAVFEGTTGVATISGNAVVDTHQGFVDLAVAHEAADGTLNLEGGTLRTTQIRGGAGISTVNFDGGQLTANANHAEFIAGLTNANIESGGMNIDTNGFAVATAQDFDGTGAVNVSGTGSLALNGTLADIDGVNVAPGATLMGTGNVGGTITIAEDATLAPGNSIGTFTASDDVVLGGTLRIEIDGVQNDFLDVLGELDITGGIAAFVGLGDGLTEPVYVFASYGNLIGSSFADVQGLPEGYHIDYNYLGGNDLAIVPEPRVYALLFGLGALTLVVLRRRKPLTTTSP